MDAHVNLQHTKSSLNYSEFQNNCVQMYALNLKFDIFVVLQQILDNNPKYNTVITNALKYCYCSIYHYNDYFLSFVC